MNSLTPSSAQLVQAELRLLLYAQMLSECYAYSTVEAYVGDLFAIQRGWNAYKGVDSLRQAFTRVKMVMKTYRKRKPVAKEQKRLWEPSYFVRVARGQRWFNATGGERWTEFATFTQWIIMVLMYQLFLRVGEVVQTYVDRHTARRPWTRASVSFWAGERCILMGQDGRPEQADAVHVTHVLLAAVPDKSNAAGSRDPFTLKVFSPKQCREASTDIPAFLFDGGRLLWALFSLYPVPRVFAGLVPLFTREEVQLPKVVCQYTLNDYHKGLRKLCNDALPRIPRLVQGKALGGHCMRGAAANHSLRLGATVTEVCRMARWQMAAFVRAKGYDYTRSRLADTAGISAAMMLNILLAPPSLAQEPEGGD